MHEVQEEAELEVASGVASGVAIRADAALITSAMIRTSSATIVESPDIVLESVRKLPNVDNLASGFFNTLEQYLIPFSKSVNPSENDLYCDHLANIQRDWLKKGYTVPSDSIHSSQAIKFYKEELGAPKLVLDILEKGYSPPTVCDLPLGHFAHNNRSARSNMSFVRLEKK